ncbi:MULTISPECIES: helix-hairpin-helix domain-containing protein [Clostridium]|uniref:DNA-binding protein, ComEA family n=1 Tax=Clostridium botulinum (strain Eklund 17B / Type B) TaxID=935198 RepID=B2TKI9_CLOBB|nr:MULTISPECIES: helix-hairpin-helix domain-containing protein [Clostridium]ACD24567.1 DNA-binding protein, ComEA family [Clostridium botulinum B str. Eklund 17B (NRP)]MBN1044280.1 competence protein ComEA [Clostridium botulinum]MBN1054245.1 competence protein ComEA [Clostridium botulinum]MBY6976465.1 helix-hairpin-helix domain-containing protein [Clostridium botulinum]MBY7001602.1 helix-hairpin-helix domain-containing protein [Clostridium botulinum]
MINKANKKIGIIAILVIILVVCLSTYIKSGKDKLVKNDNTSIFVEEENPNINEDEKIEKLKDKNIVVEIKGEVKKPDVYQLNDESIVKDVIEIAGGLTEEADISNINRAQKLKNHELIYIHNKSEVKDNVSYAQNTVTTSNNSGKININCAQLEELKNLNGIGEAKAKRIIEYRENIGAFNSIEDIKNIDGIGEKSFEKLKDQIDV